jgi:hypothetical protein
MKSFSKQPKDETTDPAVANETARAKRFRNLCAVHQRQREIEAGQLQRGGMAK